MGVGVLSEDILALCKGSGLRHLLGKIRLKLNHRIQKRAGRLGVYTYIMRTKRYLIPI